MQIITLGIGTPGDIPHFILFGLSPSGVVVDPPMLAAEASLRVMPLRATSRAIAERHTTRTVPLRRTIQEAP